MPKIDTIKSSLDDAIQHVISPFTFFVWLASIILGVVAGPFGTLDEMDWPVRSVFWLFIVTLAVVLGYGARAVAMILVGPGRPAAFDIVAIVTMTTVFSPVIWLSGQWFERMFGAVVPPLPMVGFYVFLMSATIFMVRRLAPGFEAPSALPDPESGDPGARTEPRLLRRLPAEQRSDILRLSANGHYIDVVTLTGEETLRMRLSDAIHEMDPVPGLYVHRSHWVAHEAISHGERTNAHKAYLVLINGDKVPVSRKFRPVLEEKGLL